MDSDVDFLLVECFCQKASNVECFCCSCVDGVKFCFCAAECYCSLRAAAEVNRCAHELGDKARS